ncbi:MAG: invasin domain 3-containing protein [Desulforegulaceae bacterium]|nr:invasin domain 3-containing protein [Desulforegulaceae bacterium]
MKYLSSGKYIVLILVALMFVISGCSSDSSSDEAPVADENSGDTGGDENGGNTDGDEEVSQSVSSIVINTGNNKIVADGKTYIVVRVVVKNDQDNVLSGKVVELETTAGTLDKNPVTTDNKGVAETKLFSAETIGKAVLSAISEGVSSSVDIDFVHGPASEIKLSASPANLTADGTSKSKVDISILDQFGNPVDGETLVLRSEYGSLDTYSVVTANGKASFSYTAPSSVPGSGRDTITVKNSGGKIESTDITIIGQQIGSISLVSQPSSLPADGKTQAIITASLTSVGGGDVPDGTQVNFRIKEGGLGTIDASASSILGNAIATLISPLIPGNATIIAEARGKTAQLNIEYTPGSIGLNIIPNSILGTGDDKSVITAKVIDASGNPIQNKAVSIVMSDNSLGALSSNSQQTNSEGEAVFNFTGSNVGGLLTFSASYDPDDNPSTVNNVTGNADITILPPPSFMQVADGFPDPSSINIKGTGGQSTARIAFNVVNTSGEPVSDGYKVNFEILDGPNGGEELDPKSALTKNGQVSTILRSGTKSGPVSLKATYHNDTNISSIVSQIAVKSGNPVGEEFSISAQYRNISGLTLANLVDKITVSAADKYGNAVPDNTAISFKTYNTGGFFSPSVAQTVSGLAQNDLYSASNPVPEQGFVCVTAEANNGGRTTRVTSIAVDPNNNIIYAGTNGGGVYKSNNAGSSWTNISRSSNEPGQNFIDPYINDIVIDPDDTDIVYAAAGYLGGGNIYKSIDAGGTWKGGNIENFDGLLSDSTAVRSVQADKGSDYIWAGTDGLGAIYTSDGIHFMYGGKTKSGPLDPGDKNSGNGTIENIVYGPSMKSEKWTATYKFNPVGAEVTSSPQFTGSSADGSINDLSAELAAGDSEWVLEYEGGYGDVEKTLSNPDNLGKLTIVSTSKNTQDTTWTVECIDITTPGEEKFRVIGSGSIGIMGEAQLNKNFKATNDEVEFYITGGVKTYALGDKFKFETMRDSWSVSQNGNQLPDKARTDIEFNNDEISFEIRSGSYTFFEKGDKWSFKTGITGERYWLVEGSESGVQKRTAKTGVTYVTDSDEVSFKITSGTTPFEENDNLEFEVLESGLGFGKIVRDIFKASGTGNTAVLYAAAATGVFKSVDGGRTWTEVSNFSEDNITCLAGIPDNDNVIYAGTKSAGVFYTTDAGNTWTKYIDGFGKGFGNTSVKADVLNKGNGTLNISNVGEDAETENWTVKCIEAVGNGGKFSVTGSVSGVFPVYDITAGKYDITDTLEFTIKDGSLDFEAGDVFTFKTVRDSGLGIKDLQVAGNRIYAITYFEGPLEEHAVGNLYSASINNTGNYSITSPWKESNAGLPQYSPPEDLTLFAQHSLAVDDIDNPKALYIGGEGINFFKSVNGLDNGNLEWFECKTGMTNLIMARMPILFSGDAVMSVTYERTGNLVTFYCYVEDRNGNPPVYGSSLRVTSNGELIFNIDYGDLYVSQGTFRDKTDTSTNRPIVISYTLEVDSSIIFEFDPACETSAPGCSGVNQTYKIDFKKLD